LTAVEQRPTWLSILDRLSVASSAFVWIAALFHLAPGWVASSAWLPLLGGALVGYVLADFFSGLVHWMADRYFDPETPVLGPALIAPFREHHADALAMTRHDFCEISGNNALATIPLALLLVYTPVPVGFTAQLLASTVFSLGLSIIATNQFHCWAHVANPPGFARLLQDWGLILSPRQHAVHHDKDHDRSYCVTSGWLNPICDRIGVFRALERGIEHLTRDPGRVR
jgi:hypothetical protein